MKEQCFRLHAPYAPAGDQPRAIRDLIDGFENGQKEQVLLGVTGSGKTFTMANTKYSIMPSIVLQKMADLAIIEH